MLPTIFWNIIDTVVLLIFMSLPAEIRSLSTLPTWFWELLCLSGSLLFILWMTVFLFVMSHLVVPQFSEQTDVLGTHSRLADDYGVVQVYRRAWYCMY